MTRNLLESNRVLSGSFGEIWMDGVWLANFNAGELSVDIQYEKIKRSGSRKAGNKPMSIECTGSIRGYKISSAFARKIGQIMDDRSGAFVCQLVMKLDDPEAYGAERVLAKGVQFTKIDVMKFEHGSPVETEWPFVFEDYEFLDFIEEK
ncbi:phage tail tube protein [Brevibacillus laterosporus]|uniref:Phage tail tube protein n=1 Tax=Brevibacillus laterosporus TaxID=1465 RepID=A0AAP3DL47_BRELA|nr:phage tail tube protein [Brevibacillus laterosporus]MBG9774216.1 phage portal protein [Brevibacillus laterosporus]MCR8983298.1 phage tail tube protein [Brevibacillus laterosporus]MCZ0810454.1 phage tail tube protein [Brevibacillus laterosporus]MCZ0829026.1 phage tail tube protein [Brevibacillus laterosporus]MCZ0853217.1 phage tail tube protein [Brevibacillus laterosporus]